MRKPGLLTVLLFVLFCSFDQNGFCKAEESSPLDEDAQRSPIVQTKNGAVQGIIEKTVWLKKPYASYIGIRFGEKPVRFEASRPAKPWTGVYDASKERNRCLQYDSDNNDYIGHEDCLFINVYTSNPSPSALKGVFFYNYGGAFKAGYKDRYYFGPELLMENDIVVAVANYRLGALGFLSTQYKTSTGNYGLKDQHLALKWVRDNIRNFGGDPNKITIVGQSAGGASVDLHALAPKFRGMFRGSIAMSASVLCPWAFMPPSAARNRAYELGSRLNCSCNNDKELIEFLRRVPAQEIAEKTQDMAKLYILPFTPTVELNDHEDAILTECPYKLLKDGKFARVPHLNGYTENEMILYASSVSTILDYLRNFTLPFNSTPIEVPIIDTATKSLLNISKSILAEFATQTTTEFLMILSDLFFVAGIEEKQNLMCKAMMPDNLPYYYYKLTKESQYANHKVHYNINLNGTAHEDDVGYIFLNRNLDIPLDPNSTLSNFRRRLARLWANFVIYLNPTPFGEKDELLEVKWPDSCPKGRQIMLDDKFTVHDRLSSERARGFQALLRNIMPIYTGCSKLETVSTIASSIWPFL